VVGDSVYDVEAAAGAGVPAYGLLTGGYGRAELMDAGARNVYEDLDDLRAHLDEWSPV
jgi:phosphoglycolate phosphatase-like HAD superfamily hydrolase